MTVGGWNPPTRCPKVFPAGCELDHLLFDKVEGDDDDDDYDDGYQWLLYNGYIMVIHGY